MPAATLTAAKSAKQGAATASTDLAVIKTQQPAAWFHAIHLPGGERVTVRPARPGDAEMLQAYVRELSASARYNRFFGPLRELQPAELARMTHMNGSSRATLIAEIGGSRPVIIGELRYAILSDAACEFAISVAEGWRRKGLGNLMLGDLQCRVEPWASRAWWATCCARTRPCWHLRTRPVSISRRDPTIREPCGS
jgi:hypothetical protein